MARRETGKQRFARVYFKYITVLLLAAMIVLGVALFTQTRGTNDETQEESTSQETTPSETETTTEPVPTEPTVAAVDSMKASELISIYYQAKVDDNVDELNRVVDSETQYNDADVLSEAQYVDRYDDFTTYVMPGADENSYIVYVKYNIYFRGISTGAPALNHFYVVKDENDNMMIYDRPLTEEQQKILADTENSAAATRLVSQVEQELQEACEVNPDLKYLIAMLNNTTVEETEADPGTEADPAEESTASEEATEAAPENADGSAEEGSEDTAASAE